MKTKRQTSIALLLSASMLTACAGGAGDIISDFKDRQHAESVHVPKMLMKIGMAMAVKDDEEDMEIARHISSVKVLDMEECNAETKRECTETIDRLEFDGYELLAKVNDATDNVSVHIRKKGSYIRELLVVNNGHDDCMMVMVKGKIHEKDINRLLLEDIVKKTYTHKK